MDSHALRYDDGYVALTETHMQVVRDGRMMENLAYKHIASASIEEAHSFRHRVFGLIAGICLLILPVGLLISAATLPDQAVQALDLDRLSGLSLVGLMCGILFGLVFLWGVITSRRIWWLRVQYGKMPKLIPLAGAGQLDVEEFLEALWDRLPSEIS